MYKVENVNEGERGGVKKSQKLVNIIYEHPPSYKGAYLIDAF